MKCRIESIFCPLQPRLREFLGGALLIFKLSVWEWYTFFCQAYPCRSFCLLFEPRVSSQFRCFANLQLTVRKMIMWLWCMPSLRNLACKFRNFTWLHVWSWLCCVSNSRWAVAHLSHNTSGWAKGPWRGFPLRRTLGMKSIVSAPAEDFFWKGKRFLYR